MADGYRVIMCWPSNRKEIDLLNKHTDQPFEPSVEHSLSHCDGCPRRIWISPQQQQLANSPLVRIRKLCIWCTESVQRTLNLTPQQVDLNPDAAKLRRRLA